MCGCILKPSTAWRKSPGGRPNWASHCPASFVHRILQHYCSELSSLSSSNVPPVMPQTMPQDPLQPNGNELKPTPPIQLAFALPLSPDTNIHLHITNLQHSTTVFLASSTTGAPPTTASCSSLVYALPNVRFPSPISRTLRSIPRKAMTTLISTA